MQANADTVAAAKAVEAPSGKGAADENFPVGSFLLPKRLRAHVATYYAFARAIDDIADDHALAPIEKIRRLRAFDAALKGEPGYGPEFAKAHALRDSMKATNVPTVHGSDLVAAFVQDCEKRRYHSWDEVVGYCEKSANPVGRYLLDLHGEDRSGYRYSDALCTVLQIVNHLQDCADDKRRSIGFTSSNHGSRRKAAASPTLMVRRVLQRSGASSTECSMVATR